jgi:hypothetical protein
LIVKPTMDTINKRDTERETGIDEKNQQREDTVIELKRKTQRTKNA